MASTTASPPTLPYEEPSITTLLTLASFLLLLNTLSSLANHLLHAGLVIQILLGILYGQPSTLNLLSPSFQLAVQQLGYLGLILVVYHGGLSTSISALLSNLRLSSAVALTGIAAPIALSFAVLPALLPGSFPGDSGTSPLQTFAAGAALSATSLGTTFAVLESSGLAGSRLGTVLASAAMIDDVVGLVLIRVITALGGREGGGGGFAAVTVVRPVLVSVALAGVLALTCRFVVAPLRERGREWLAGRARPRAWIDRLHTRLVLQTLWLVGLCAGAYYAGTSILYAAYLAGAAVSWWDTPGTTKAKATVETSKTVADASAAGPSTRPDATIENKNVKGAKSSVTGLHVFETYYAQALDRILMPFFFASIGFSIPITQLFDGRIVWRGIIYSILMILAKNACGLWLIRFDIPLLSKLALRRSPRMFWRSSDVDRASTPAVSRTSTPADNQMNTASSAVTAPSPPAQTAVSAPNLPNSSRRMSREPTASAQRPLSLYPAGILGCAMVARGEIGFLISALAESSGIFAGSQGNEDNKSSDQSSGLFLIVTWAILVCTVLGPIVTGLLVGRVKRLQKGERSGREDPLGIWGVL